MLGCAGGKERPVSPSEPIRLTVVTYNVHHAEGTDKRLDLERVARVIRSFDADFVALQEVDNGAKRSGGVDQSAELARLTNMHVAYGPSMPFQGGQYGNAVLSRHPITASRVVHLPWKEGGRREPRCAVAARTMLPGKAGVTVEFISTHFDHTREPSDRSAQAEAVNASWKDATLPTILAGDINCEPGSAPMDALGRAWTLVSGTDAAAPTCCGAAPKVKIDHVLVRPSTAWRVIEHRVIDEPVVSDHRPVLVKLELR